MTSLAYTLQDLLLYRRFSLQVGFKVSFSHAPRLLEDILQKQEVLEVSWLLLSCEASSKAYIMILGCKSLRRPKLARRGGGTTRNRRWEQASSEPRAARSRCSLWTGLVPWPSHAPVARCGPGEAIREAVF